jgi:hypothetical protein
MRGVEVKHVRRKDVDLEKVWDVESAAGKGVLGALRWPMNGPCCRDGDRCASDGTWARLSKTGPLDGFDLLVARLQRAAHCGS